METLSAEEKQILLEIINEEFGPDLTFDDFQGFAYFSHLCSFLMMNIDRKANL